MFEKWCSIKWCSTHYYSYWTESNFLGTHWYSNLILFFFADLESPSNYLKPTLGYRCSLSWGKKALLSCCFSLVSKNFQQVTKKIMWKNWETTTASKLAWNLRRANTMLRKTNEKKKISNRQKILQSTTSQCTVCTVIEPLFGT